MRNSEIKGNKNRSRSHDWPKKAPKPCKVLKRFFAELNESMKLLRSERTSTRFGKNPPIMGSSVFFCVISFNPFWKFLRLGNSACDFLGVNFWSRDFFGFWFLPSFDHPRHLKLGVPPWGCVPPKTRFRRVLYSNWYPVLEIGFFFRYLLNFKTPFSKSYFFVCSTSTFEIQLFLRKPGCVFPHLYPVLENVANMDTPF